MASNSGLRLVVAAIIATMVVWLPSVAIWHLVEAIYPGPRNDIFFQRPLFAIAGGILLAPLLETLALGWFINFLRRRITGEIKIAVLVAIAAWLAHLQSESWGLHAAWGFFAMSIFYLRIQEERNSKDYALIVVIVIHAICNALTYGLYLMTA